jgi:membrane protein
MHKLIQTVKKAVRDFSEDDCMSSAAAMAYYAIFSLPPLLILIVTIAGYFGLQPERIRKMVRDQWGVAASGDKPEQQQDQDEANHGNANDQNEKPAGAFGVVPRIVGVLLLIFSATGLFAQLQYTLNRAWEVKPDPKRGGVLAFIGKRILSLGMILVIVFLLLVSMVLTTIIDEVIAYFQGGPPNETTIVLGITLNNLAAFVVATLLFAAMYRLLPDAEIAWRDVWFGAVVTGLLFVAGKTLIALYLQNTDLASGWGEAAASMIGVLVWMYYSSLIVLFGAELTQAWASAHGRGIRPAKGAVTAEAAG